MSAHDDDEDAAEQPTAARNPFVAPDPHGEIVRQAPPVRRMRPETKPGKLRQLEVGDAYKHAAAAKMTAQQRRNQKCAWIKAAKEIGIKVQISTDDDHVLWIYRRG